MANSKENTPTGSPSPSEENLSDKIRLAAKIDFAATISSAKKGREPPPSAPRRSRKSSSSDKPRSSKKSSSSEKILKLMENLVKPLADGFESMRAQQKKTQEQATYHQELERVNRRLDEVDSKVHRATSSAPELTKALADTRRSPLTRRLRQIELHERVRLKIDSYTGEEDPKKWLTAFNLAMRREKYKSYDEREANYCQVFVEHMAKDALTWFSNLPAESIDNFDDLTNAFLKHYSMHMTRITRNMFTTTQTQGEPLRSFMERFKQAARDTGDMPDSVPLEALRNGLWYDSKFKEDLSLKPPATLEDAFHRSRNYIFLEEDQRFYAEKHGDRRATSTKPREEPMEARRRHDPKRSLLTAFAAADDEFEQEHAAAVSMPQDINSLGDDNDTKAFCKFHGRTGHATENCKHLMSNLMRMYHRGEIPPMDGDRKGGSPLGKRNRDDHDDLPPPPKRQVSMIMGGFLDNDDSISAIKEYERKAVAAQRYPYIHKGIPTISFTDKDASGLDIPHLDPLEGSIKPTSRPLTGFTAEHVYSCGTVRLPVYVGGISKLLKFIVMDKPAIYNAILGTPWLHEMKAVISTFHQCVKFPIPSGIFTLRGDQRVTRSCFLRERKLRTASSCMITEPVSDDETNESNAIKRAAQRRMQIPRSIGKGTPSPPGNPT
ncbi:unnamed protein product [Microthlaspi erraticum]|uniref:Retrotransposon gag domain-containing protein n=2 Tax=Microthlaspi erraticum TaxID=1685480 RepID=A0A6D2KET9_9BRAS|nr:unnamed protein product [Microthlaspi erraticum]